MRIINIPIVFLVFGVGPEVFAMASNTKRDSTALIEQLIKSPPKYQKEFGSYLKQAFQTHYLQIYGSVVCLFLILMAHGGIINRVHYFEPRNPIKFVGNDGKNSFTLKELIGKKIPTLRDQAMCLLNPFLFTGDLQTMYAGVRTFHSRDQLYFGRQILRMRDGGSAALDQVISSAKFRSAKPESCDIPEGQKNLYLGKSTRYFTKKELLEQDGQQSKRPIVLALHGLSGSSAEPYCRCLMNPLFNKEHFDCFVLNARGCGGVNITTPSLFCALWTEDVREAVKVLRQRYPGRPIFAVGFSMGSIILTNYLAQEGDKSGIDFAVTLACIWDLRASSNRLESHFLSGNLYSPRMTKNLLELIANQKDELSLSREFKKSYSRENIRKMDRLSHFDDNFTSKMFGFSCADEYYCYASPIIRMNNIRTPLLNINSEDDPVAGGFDVGALPVERASFNPYITMITTTHGGHLGWFKPNNVRWYTEPVSQLMAELYSEVYNCSAGNIQVDKHSLPADIPISEGKLVMKTFKS